MAYTETRFCGLALTDTNATVYTVPGSSTAIVKELVVSNTSGLGALTVDLSFAGVAIMDGTSIPSRTMTVIPMSTVLNTTELIEASCSFTGGVSLFVSGILVT